MSKSDAPSPGSGSQPVKLRMQGAPRKDEALRKSPTWLAMGFRPFFLCAALFACIATALWLHALASGRDPGGGYIAMNYWHAHEMLHGFVMAVVAGFLLTASRNWTGRNTAHGYALLGLVLLWALGRVLMSGRTGLPNPLVAACVVAFPLALAAVVGRVIVGAGSRRNYGIVVILLAVAGSSLFVHLDALGVTPGATRPALYGGLHLIVLLTVVIGGRIIPLFTRNRCSDDSIRSWPAVDRAALILAALVVPASVIAWLPGAGDAAFRAYGGLAFLSGCTQLLRMRWWGTRSAIRVPMLAILHAGYLWIAIGQLLVGVASVRAELPHSLALHALTIGAIGGLIVGMMARVTIGHTGRTIQAGTAARVAFVSINLAVAARLCAALVPATQVRITWYVSGGLFALSLAAYLVGALPLLLSARPDGRPG